MTFNDVVKKGLQLRGWLLILLSQIIRLISCAYFILKVNEYELSWNILNMVFLNMAASINNVLHRIGTYILVVPLTIIIASWLFPENILLKMAGTLFGVASTLIMLFSGFLRGTLTETYNMRVFLITKILTLEEKRVIFKAEYTRIVDDLYKTKLELYRILQERLLEKYFIVYDEHLIQLKERLAIKLYAGEIITNTVTSVTHATYLDTLKHSNTAKYLVYLVGGILVICTIAFGLNYLFNNLDTIKSLATHTKKSAELSQAGASNTADALQAVQEGLILAPQISAEVASAGLEALNKSVADAFAKTSSAIAQLHERVGDHDQALNFITSTLIKVHNTLP